MKNILLIATGGTIASVHTDMGLSPSTQADELLKFVPEVKEFANVKVKQVLNIDSTNIEPEHWIKISEVIKENYDYDGFVITHGTDTMAFTAAALSYLIQNSEKPIILTGAQKPISERITDGIKNLKDAIRFASEDNVRGVYIVFDGKAIVGTRAKKLRSKSFSAFDSINYPNAAFIDGNKIYRYVDEEVNKEEVKFYDKLNPKVFNLKLTPGMEPDILNYIFKFYDGVILETYGVGGIPFESRRNFLKELNKHKDKIVVIATQVMLEGSDAMTYEVGYRFLKSQKVIEAYDMTVEACLVKLMWILAITKDYDEVRKLFYKKINKDILRGED
ncbi:L-asparaginase [Peptoniphilus koenoeneniae]|uniref:asparaginase n=1 Tax=Peptoniphilus koenoeneniae TaxID=507751 RepID=A0ABU0ASY1_9FIRM|nr:MULTISPECIES: asparaginase [Peptoniphilus]ERT62549.1 L-asparaginase, type I [Peptoniphilus sp. BV3C26]MDQ0274345.1 L-asparaginase [Peptoniphilus koenoeneniae]